REIMAAVFFALLLLAANTMMESVRERTAEIGVLRTVGFSEWKVVELVLVEALLLFLTGTALGLAGAQLVFGQVSNRITVRSGFVDVATLPTPAILLGCAISVTAALLSAAIPAWRA